MVLRGVLCILQITCTAVENAPPNAEQRELCRAVIDGYRANRDAFRLVKCRFTVRDWKVDSLDEALAGAGRETVAIAKGSWVTDGTLERFEVLCDPETQRAFTAGQAPGPVMTAPLPSTSYLSDGVNRLSASAFLRIASVYAERVDIGRELGPFDMGVMGRDEQADPPAMIELALQGKFGVDATAEAISEDGQPCLQVRLTGGAGTVETRYVLDPAKGFLPRRLEFIDRGTGEVTTAVHVTGFRRTPAAGWFPARSVTVPGVVRPGTRAREIVVDELNVGERPTPKDFEIELPAWTRVSEPNAPFVSQMVLTDARRIGPEMIGAVIEQCRHDRGTIRSRPPLFQTAQTRWFLILNSVLVGAGLVVIAIVWYWRRQAVQRSGTE